MQTLEKICLKPEFVMMELLVSSSPFSSVAVFSCSAILLRQLLLTASDPGCALNFNPLKNTPWDRLSMFHLNSSAYLGCAAQLGFVGLVLLRVQERLKGSISNREGGYLALPKEISYH